MKYQVVAADPSWQFRTRGTSKAISRSAERHYPTMKLKDIKALGPLLQPHLAEDCALFLWVVNWYIPEAIEVGQSWGFSFKTTAFFWTKETRKGKVHWGTGYWTRANPEQVLLFTKGNPKRASGSVHSWVHSKVGKHSEKPDEVYHRIEKLMGPGPKLELFARKPRPGWVTVGHDVNDGRDIRDVLSQSSL